MNIVSPHLHEELRNVKFCPLLSHCALGCSWSRHPARTGGQVNSVSLSDGKTGTSLSLSLSFSVTSN